MNGQAKKMTVLVVDDYYIICNLLKSYLRDQLIEVITCSNGVEGVKKAYEVKPDLIFLDLFMPDLDGIKMLQVIRSIEQLKKTPVIVISANTNRTNVLNAIEAGADRVISKPLKKEIILKNLSELLGIDLLPAENKIEIETVEDAELIKQLQKDFLDFFNSRKTEFETALINRNGNSLRKFIHDMKGIGGAIGYPELTSISADIQDDLLVKETDWDIIKLKCGKIMCIVGEIENRLNG
jgi:CheY-like chemotaxis protein